MSSLKTRIEDLVVRIATEFKSVRSSIGSLDSLTTTAKTSIILAINELVTSISGKQTNLGFTPENTSNKGNINGYASLDGTGKVPAEQLPSYVDDVLEFANLAAFPAIGSTGIIYVAIDLSIGYRWTGTTYAALNGALSLGETSGTAYRGDRGKTAYDHSQATGNPHGTNFSDLNSKPTTVSGYGITDVYTQTDIGNPDTNFVSTFETNLL